jgi:hypothetical protein
LPERKDIVRGLLNPDYFYKGYSSETASENAPAQAVIDAFFDEHASDFEQYIKDTGITKAKDMYLNQLLTILNPNATQRAGDAASIL